MSVIQKIRDKYAKVAVVAIALALLGFILMDALVGRTSLFGGANSSTVGRVNGEKIDITEFDKKIQQQEDFMKQQGYSQPGEASRQQAIDAVWNQEVSRILMEEETDRSGTRVDQKEINDYLFGNNPPEDLKRQFTDPQTGQYNAAEAPRQINEMKRKGTAAQKENFNTYIIQLEHARKVEKYNSLLTNSINFPRWLIEKENTDNSLMGKISLVREVYSSISDSLVKITDKEIEDYISDNKDDYKQEESRSIAYVVFSAAPSAKDSADARDKLMLLKEKFDTTQDVRQLLASEGVNNYYPGYISGKAIQIPVKDSIFRTPVATAYGPYLDAGNYMLAKLEGVKQMPDTVTVRHILIGTSQLDTATAYKRIDSIQTAIRNGANFDSVAAKLSEDPGSKDKGGVYENVPSGQMV